MEIFGCNKWLILEIKFIIYERKNVLNSFLLHFFSLSSSFSHHICICAVFTYYRKCNRENQKKNRSCIKHFPRWTSDTSVFAVSFIVNNIKSLVCLWNVFRRVKFIDYFFFRALPLCSHNLPDRYPSLSLPFSGAPVHLVIRFLDAFFSLYLAKSYNTHPCVRYEIRYSVFGVQRSAFGVYMAL